MTMMDAQVDNANNAKCPKHFDFLPKVPSTIRIDADALLQKTGPKGGQK
jgi:hypothetical protein